MSRTVTYEYVPGTPLTEDQHREIEEASKRPIVYDDDCPALSPKLRKALQEAVKERNRSKAL